jgi:sialic acid synthase SpsE
VSEQRNLPIVRKSLVAATPIQPGEQLTNMNITAKRPGTGISPMYWDSLIGQKSNRAYAPDELIQW